MLAWSILIYLWIFSMYLCIHPTFHPSTHPSIIYPVVLIGITSSGTAETLSLSPQGDSGARVQTCFFVDWSLNSGFSGPPWTHCWVAQVLRCPARSCSRSKVRWDPVSKSWSDSKKPPFCCEVSLFSLENNKLSNPQISFPSIEYAREEDPWTINSLAGSDTPKASV